VSETIPDPLDRKSGAYELPLTDDAIVHAFELAASSFAVNLGLPNAKYYQPTSEPPLPELPPPPKPAPAPVPASVRAAPDPTIQPRVPNPGLIYPPPIPDESDPDHLRLLHSWYWAGYYTGLTDGRRVPKQ
jgi:hypothetical protein